jgi:hypothetical protein
MERLKEYLKQWYYIDKETGCWLWKDSKKHATVYPTLIVKGKTQRASRIFYSVYKAPYPHHLCVCHTCDTPGCVNPEHLFLGTYKDNMVDKVNKGRCGLGGKSKFRKFKFTKQEAEKIREVYERVKDYTIIAKKLKVSPNTIRTIVLNENYGK